MQRYRKLMTICAAAVLALGLAACGGGGGDDGPTAETPTTPTMPEPMPPAPEPVAVDLPMLPTGDMYALSAGEHEIAAGGTAENGGVMFACAAGGEACVVTVTADGTASSTGGAVTASLTSAAEMAYNAQKAAMMAQLEGRAAGLSSAVTDTAGTRGEAIRGDTKASALNYSRGMSGGAMVSHSTVGWTTGDAGMSISGWAGRMVSKGTQSYTVYTDIANAKRKAYDKAYSNDGTTTMVPTVLQADDGTPITGLTVAVAPTSDTDPARGQLGLTAGAMTMAANKGLLDPMGFPMPPEPGKATKTYTYSLNEGDTSGTSGQFFKRFTGTFHGATGTYQCGAADADTCTVAVTAPSTVQGASYAVTGAWTFTPDTKNNPQIVEQDTDHIRFGWWLNDPAKAAVGGEYLYDAQVFAGGNQAFPVAKIAAVDSNGLHGKVNYEGPAAGLFAVTGDAAAHGEFMATAKLTADFGAIDAAGGSVSGTIGSFVRDDGVANDWALTLSKADLAAGDAANTGAGNIVDGNKKIGGWSYGLFGPGGTGNVPPTGIAGTFDAKIDANTAVAGAFGAK